MSEIATIRSGIDYVQEIFKQISVLLLTADQQMADEGFGAYGNACLDDRSFSIGAPARWMPRAIFRFYMSKNMPRVLLFTSVLLDDRDAEYAPMEDCLLTAGAFIHKDGRWDNKNWDWWWARWHGFHRPRRDDGSINLADSKDWSPEDGNTQLIEKILTIGRPLPEVRSAADLKAFLAPLLREIAPYRQEAA